MAPANAPAILVVEDEPDLAALITGLLNAEGYRIALACNGRQALALAASDHPALVVLDLALPGVDGREVLRSLKAQRATADIPVIVVSAYVGRLSAEDRGLIRAVLEKPFNLDALLSAVALAVQRGVAGHSAGLGRDALPAAMLARMLGYDA